MYISLQLIALNFFFLPKYGIHLQRNKTSTFTMIYYTSNKEQE